MTTKIEISSSMSQVDVCIVNKEVTFIGPRANSSIDAAFAIVLSSKSGFLTLIPLESRVLTYKSRTLRPHEPVQIKANNNERFTFNVEGGIQCRVLRAPRQSAPPTTLPMTEIDDDDDDELKEEEKHDRPDGESPTAPKSDNNATVALPPLPSYTLPLPETSNTPENRGSDGATVTLAMPEEKSTSNLPTATVPMAGGEDTSDEEEEADIVTDDNEDEATRESAASHAATVPVETQLVTQAGVSDLVTQGSVNELEPLVTQLDDDLPPGEIMTTQSESDKPSPQKEETDDEGDEDDANSIKSEDMLLQKTVPLTPHTAHRTTAEVTGGGNGAFSTPSRRLASAAESFRSPSTAIFDHMTDDEIRSELASHRLDTSGSRTVLAKRLAAHRAMSDNDLEDLPRTTTPRKSPGVGSLAPTTLGSALSKNTRRIVDEENNTAPTLRIEEDDGTSPTLKIPLKDDHKGDSSNGKDEMVIKSQSLREALKAERSPLHIDLTSSHDATTGSHFSNYSTGEALMALTKSNAESTVVNEDTDKNKKIDGKVLMIKEDGETEKSKQQGDVETNGEVMNKSSKRTKAKFIEKSSATTEDEKSTTARATTRSTRGAKKGSKEEEEGRPIVRVGTVEAAHALKTMRSSVSPTTNNTSAGKQSSSTAEKNEEEEEEEVDSAKKRGRRRITVKQEEEEEEKSEEATTIDSSSKSKKKTGGKKNEPIKEKMEDEEPTSDKRPSRRRVVDDDKAVDADTANAAEPLKEEEAAPALKTRRRGQAKPLSSNEKVVENETKKAKVDEEETDESIQPRKSGRRSSSSKAAGEEVSPKVKTESAAAGPTKAEKTGGKVSPDSAGEKEIKTKLKSSIKSEGASGSKRGRMAKVEAEPDLKTSTEDEKEKEVSSTKSSRANRSGSKSTKKVAAEGEEETASTVTTTTGDGPSSALKRARVEEKKTVGSASKKQSQHPKEFSPPHIVFTNLEVTDVYRKYVAKIGGSILNGDDEDFDRNLVTHVVCLKGSLKRTQKLLRAMAMAGPNAPKIVHNDWLKDSADQGKILDEKLYYPFEDEANMEEALRLRHRDESEGLLSGMTILVAKSLENEKNLPNYQSLLPIVTSAGGQIAIASKEVLNKCSPKTTIVLGPNQAFTKPFKDVIEKRKLTWCAPTWLAQSIASYSLKTDSSDIIFHRGSFFI